MCEYTFTMNNEWNCSVNREIYLYHERANAIRPYDNGILHKIGFIVEIYHWQSVLNQDEQHFEERSVFGLESAQ